MTYVVCLIVAILSFVLGYIFSKRKKIFVSKKEKQKLSEQYLLLNKELEDKKKEVEQEYQNYRNKYDELIEEDNQRLQNYYLEKKKLNEEKIQSEYNLSMQKLQENITKTAQEYSSRLDESLRKNREEFDTKTAELALKREKLEKELSNLKQMRDSAIEVAKRNEEIKTKSDFYRLVLPDADLEDIQELKKVEKVLNNKEVLNKIIYKVYFEKPYTDLIGRVVGKTKVTGIYKITNLNNEKVYIGQAVDIAERWKQHIKRALGAEPITQNKLYPAMEKEGVWNFSFEIVEKCTKDKLSEKEQYWQKFFGAKEFGYSIK